VVPRDEMVKGYEFAKDQYVTFTNEEIKSLEEKATQAIAIAQFVPADKVDPIYLDRPYYLAPDKGGEKAYRLLVEVMRQSGRAAIARYAARDRLYLVMLRPVPGAQPGVSALVMQQLLYADEVRPLAEVPIPEGQSSEAELKLAGQVVEQIASDSFDPAVYRNDVRDRMQAEIERKVAGHEISVSAAPEQPAQIIDLMEALKASLAARGQPTAPDTRELGERKPPRSAAPHGVRSKARASRG
jgi:DNA end-binding protein Ku